MSTHLETEFKMLINKTTYHQMLTAFQKNLGQPIIQTNEYFQDRHGILKKHFYSLRVRHLDGTYEFTLKKPCGFAKMEYNQMLDEPTYQKLKLQQPFPSPILDELKKDDVMVEDLFAITTLTTTRYTFPYENGQLFLDVSRYNQKVDYEVEFEAEDETHGREIFKALMHCYGYQYEKNCPGKMTRALLALE